MKYERRNKWALELMLALAEEEKKYEAIVKIKVLGYLIGSEKNQETPKIAIRENRVDLKFNRERTWVGDINEIGSEDFRP